MTIELDAGSLDLGGIVRPGDHVLWSQGTAEPLSLTHALVAQRATLGPLSVFIGCSFTDTLQPAHGDHLRMASYCAIGSNGALSRAGVLDIVPCHYSELPRLVGDGTISCDVALIQIAPDGRGGYSPGVGSDYMREAAARARVVIAEENDALPVTCGGGLEGLRIDYRVRVSRDPLVLPGVAVGDVERRLAEHAAALIPDRAVIQTGIGSIPDAVLSALKGHRSLGLHTGMMADSMVALIESGVIDNAHKAIDRGLSVAGVLFGSERLYRFAHRNPALVLQPIRYTHNPEILARLERFVALNSAIEVDLTGQVNAEVAQGTYIGAVGGQIDFVRAALRSPGGRSLIALPATARRGELSRIVARLPQGVVTTPRADADVIVTEWGAAELRGQTLRERARRMITIAHPDFRESLERESHALFAHL
ncbi:MAG: acetyl-CoA hydrolase/transferase family protein [Proteobacteria bacterium]|nr:acetyl-CoA hydrolase/transferase family protein [Pseudomonadota bacterium]HQR03343.1 acetyl-CoA hydrolase/transferase C-terminal domain-containing protein [Rhodocyclaceae bacterium]